MSSDNFENKFTVEKADSSDQKDIRSGGPSIGKFILILITLFLLLTGFILFIGFLIGYRYNTVKG